MPCAFCEIRDGKIPAIRVAEEERALAFMDRNPVNEGFNWPLVPGDLARMQSVADRIRGHL